MRRQTPVSAKGYDNFFPIIVATSSVSALPSSLPPLAPSPQRRGLRGYGAFPNLRGAAIVVEYYSVKEANK